MNQKVAIYVRVSTSYQVDKDSLSVQKRELIAYANLVLNIPDYEIFEDPGYSAKNTDRPAFQMMMAKFRTGEFSHLLVWKIDRVSRNLLDFTSMYNELQTLGVTFVSKNEQFDTSTAIGEAMMKIILVFAELERNMTAERVSAVMLSRASNGQWNGGRIPFGYSYDKSQKSFSINEAEAKTYRLIVNMYESRQSIIYVTRYLNENHIYNRADKPWNAVAIHKLLVNRFYLGEYVYNMRQNNKKRDPSEWITVPDHHPALIEQKQFDHIAFILKKNRRGGHKEGDTYLSKNHHLFSGLIRCGYCGHNMTATPDKARANGYRPSSYRCANRRMNDCPNKYISDISVGPLIFNLISNIISSKRPSAASLEKNLGCHIHPDDLNLLIRLIKDNRNVIEYSPETSWSPTDTISVTALTNTRLKQESALNRLKTLYLYDDSVMSEAEYIVERNKIIDEINSIDRQLSIMTISEDDDLIKKGSYFIMTEQLMGKKILFEKFIRTIDPDTPKQFFAYIIDHMVATDGHITSVTFKNGLTLRFIYPE